MEYKYGEVSVIEENGGISIFISEDHELIPDLREIGGRYNSKRSAFVIGSTYPARVKAAIKKLNTYNEKCKVKKNNILEGVYGPVRVIHPADNTGFILIFEKYSPEIKDKLKEMVSGSIYVGLTRTWHIPLESKKQLSAFLNSI